MDMHTLHVEHAVFLGLYTVLTLVNSWLHRGTKGVYWFPVYNLFAFAGSVLIALRGHIPDSVSIVVGDMLFPIGYLFLNLCLTEFFGEGGGKGIFSWRTQLGLTLLTLVPLIRYELIHPDTEKRLFGYSLTLSIQIALIAIFVFRRASGTLLVSGGLMAWVLAMLSLNDAVRLVGLLVVGVPANYLHSGTFLTWMMLNISALQGGITVAFVWMTAAALRQDLHVQATTDPLTGLLNRRAITTAAERLIAASRQSHQPLSAILLDLDAFKLVNDTFGHQFGDAALTAVARCLQRHVRCQDLLARLGGDEFVVLLPNASIETATEIAERLRVSIEELQVNYADMQSHMSASFGLAQLQDTSVDWEQLMTRCDKALYTVKSAGGNAVKDLSGDLATVQ
jgi:diguanylate cyclase (GGDEF)-like protein